MQALLECQQQKIHYWCYFFFGSGRHNAAIVHCYLQQVRLQLPQQPPCCSSEQPTLDTNPAPPTAPHRPLQQTPAFTTSFSPTPHLPAGPHHRLSHTSLPRTLALSTLLPTNSCSSHHCAPPPIPQPGLNITSSQVMRELERLNQRKAAGPDHTGPRMLKACAAQLCGVLSHLFNLSLHLQRVPVLWKTSCLVPVPKKGHPVALDDYRPIALTSHIVKVMERLVLAHLRPLVCPSQDPLKCAHQPHVGVDDNHLPAVGSLTPPWIDPTPQSASCSLASPAPSTPSSPGC